MSSFGGDPVERAATQLAPLINLFQTYKVVVAWRFHPKHPDASTLWDNTTKSRVRSVNARSVDLTNLYLASDFVVADWGHTDAYKAVIFGIPTVTMLFPDDLERRKGVGYPEGIPPIIATDPEWGARDVSNIRKLLQRTMTQSKQVHDYTLAVRTKPFLGLVNSHAADRIAKEVMKYLR